MLWLLRFLFISLCLLISTALSASELAHKTFASKTLNRDYTYNIYLPDGYQNSSLSPAVYAPIPPEDSSASRQDRFLTNGKFDADLWASKNWVSSIDAYKAKGIVVPFYINTGDHDRYDTAYFAAIFYQQLWEYQPDYTELRIFDGDHNFAAWGATVGNATECMSGFISAPNNINNSYITGLSLWKIQTTQYC